MALKLLPTHTTSNIKSHMKVIVAIEFSEKFDTLGTA